MLEESQLPTLDPDICIATRYALMWASKESTCVTKNKLFWVFLEMDLCTMISERPRLSPVLFEQYKEIENFKVNFHHVQTRAKKELEEVWYELA